MKETFFLRFWEAKVDRRNLITRWVCTIKCRICIFWAGDYGWYLLNEDAMTMWNLTTDWSLVTQPKGLMILFVLSKSNFLLMCFFAKKQKNKIKAKSGKQCDVMTFNWITKNKHGKFITFSTHELFKPSKIKSINWPKEKNASIFTPKTHLSSNAQTHQPSIIDWLCSLNERIQKKKHTWEGAHLSNATQLSHLRYYINLDFGWTGNNRRWPVNCQPVRIVRP